MSDGDLLPEKYSSGWGKRYPLRVGGWVRPGHWDKDSPQEPLNACFLWRIEERKAGKYVAVAYGIKKTVVLTPDNCWYLYPLQEKLSKRLRMESCPAQWKRFVDQGIGVVFLEEERGRVVFSMEKSSRYNRRIVLMPIWIAGLEKDPELMERWLGQMLWCAMHPRKADALFWGIQQGIQSFGRWPNLLANAELDALGSELLPAYREQKKIPLTQEEIEAAWARTYAHVDSIHKELDTLKSIRAGERDESLLPGLQSLLDGTGVDINTL